MDHNLFNYVHLHFWQNYIVIMLPMQLLFELVSMYPKVPTLSKKKMLSTHLPSLLLPPSPRRPHSTGKSFRAKLWFESQLYLLWVKWSWASDVSSFHSFPRAELSIGMEKQVESIYWISQLSACSPASSIYPKVLLCKRY